MPVLVRVRAEEEELPQHSSGGVSLTWLLPLAIGGGILLFLAIGLLLAWRIKGRKEECTTMVYSMGDVEGRRRSTTRLSKRKRLASEPSTSRFSSRLSLTLPPVLPPLPSYDEFLGHTRGRTRERSWVDEDALHGPKVHKSTRDSWLFNRDSWFGRPPTLPAVDTQAQAQTQMQTQEKIQTQTLTQVQVKQKSHAPKESNVQNTPQQMVQLPKRNSRSPVKQLQPPPMVAMQHGALRNWSRPMSQAQRPLAMDSSLQDILRSTEQRLQSGGSQLFERSIPPSSSSDTSFSKPSDSGQSLHLISSTSNNKNLGAPPKRASDQRSFPLHRRNSSVFSVGSATNSPGEGPPEMELMGLGAGRQTFGRLTSDDDDEPQIDLDLQPAHQRSTSAETQASSSLSTLYSVGEPEEDRSRGLGVDRRAQVQPPPGTAITIVDNQPRVNGPRPLRRQNLSITSVGCSVEELAMPMPLRPISTNAPSGAVCDLETLEKLENSKMPTLQPPLAQSSEEARPKTSTGPKELAQESPSETSRVSESSSDHHSETVELPQRDTPCSVWCMESEPSRSPPQTPPPEETTSKLAEELSPPLDEDELMSILMSTTTTKRILPVPPLNNRAGGSRNSLTTQGPSRPRLRLATDARRLSRCSSVGSDYDNDWWMTNEQDMPPSRRTSTIRANRNSQAIGSTIAQLRRMNSTLSTYSIASTMLTDSESTSALNLASYPPSPTKPSGISSRHYFNIGGTGSVRSKSKQQQHAQRRRNSRRISVAMHPAPLMQRRQQRQHLQDDHGKENQAPDARAPHDDASSGPGRNGTFSRDPTLVGRAALGSVDELKVAEEWRRRNGHDAEDDLSMYDNGDGFLQDLPEKDAKNRCLRM